MKQTENSVDTSPDAECPLSVHTTTKNSDPNES